MKWMKSKKFLFVIFASAVMLCTFGTIVFADTVDKWDGTADTSWYNPADPKSEYVLYTAEQLAGLAKLLDENSGSTHLFWGAVIKLGADIDLKNLSWLPIGTVTYDKSAFKGSFDGQGHTIYNLNVTHDTVAGLFGQLGNYDYSAYIKDLTIENATVVAESREKSYAGALVARANGYVISGITVKGEINISGYSFVGGMIGHSYARISDCRVEAYGTVSSGNWQCGGLVGSHNATAAYGASINNCSVIGDAINGGLSISAYNGAAAGAIGRVTLTGIDSTTLDNLEVSNVSISATNNYGLGYISTAVKSTNGKISNVEITLSGEPYVGDDGLAQLNGVIYTTFDDAIAAAQERDKITVLPGIHTEGFNIPKGKNNITIEGSVGDNGELLTEIQAANTIRGEHITIRNIKFNYGEDKIIRSWYGGDGSNGDYITIENCEFYGSKSHDAISLSKVCVVRNVVIDTCNRGIHIGNPKNVLIDGAKITNATYGVHAADPSANSEVVLINSDIDCSWANSFAEIDKIVIENNVFRCTQPYYQDMGYGYGVNTYSPNTTIMNNVFKNNSRIRITFNKGITEENIKKLKISHNYFADGIENALESESEPGRVTITTSVMPAYLDEAKTILSNVQVIDSAVDGNISVSVPKLYAETKDDLLDNAVFRVSVKKTVPKTKLYESEIGEGEKVEYIDISLLKNNESVSTTGPQKVIITLNEPIVGNVSVYHWNGTAWEEIPCTVDGNTIIFEVASFSPFAIVYDAGSVNESDIAAEVEVYLEKVTDAEYNIVLQGKDGKIINRFMSAELGFTYTAIEGTVSYEIEGASNVTVTPLATSYILSMNGIESSLTGNKLVIGKVKFEGRGKGSFSINAIGAIINTAEAADNIVAKYTAADGNLMLPGEATEINVTMPVQRLTIQIKFNNKINDNVPEYQDMKITISGGDLTNPITYDLGGNLADDAYVVTQDLTKDFTYMVTVSGAGYRTVRYNVNMSSNKTLNFWNNVKDNAVNVEEGNNASAKKVTFLAGDIVKDNQINLYDLSAVVSYFGMIDLNSAPSMYKYVKYDLNRDGKIDSKDVAYVLVSWGN